MPSLSRCLTFSLGGTLTGNKNARLNAGREDLPTYTFAGVDTVVQRFAEGSSTDIENVVVPNWVQFSHRALPEAVLLRLSARHQARANREGKQFLVSVITPS